MVKKFFLEEMAFFFTVPLIQDLFVKQSLQANQEATELLENMRKSKDEVHLQMQKLQVNRRWT